MRPVDWLIVGSGPAGCAAAAALVIRGIKPVILDGGIVSVPVPVGGAAPTRQEPGRKAWFGSTQAYEQITPPALTYEGDVLARASYGRGGFSRVWGATAELSSDWTAWPSEALPTTEDIDLLWRVLPRATTAWGMAIGANSSDVPGSELSKRVLDRVQRAADRAAWIVEPSVVAIDTGQGSVRRCRPCTQCLTGCLRGSIWYSGQVVEAWAATDLVDYRPGHVVESVDEERGGVRVSLRTDSGVAETLWAGRVLVAAGALSSAAIVVSSGILDEVRVRETATAFGGIVGVTRAPAGDGFHHGLSQWWIKDKQDHIMAQVYAPSSDHAERIAARIPKSLRGLRLNERVAKRVHPLVAYLSEAESGSLLISRGKFGVTVSADSKTERETFIRRLKPLADLFKRSGMWMPLRAIEFTPPGTGYHFGASLPHGLITDALGRLAGSQRVHFVDSSVLPTIRLGSVTPTVMLNAMRIARQVDESAA
ncbi:MAG: hypothetical protein JW395_2154 [Nitrospira sp.]|nr:hypothetical protein [Nitrospira sp.]